MPEFNIGDIVKASSDPTYGQGVVVGFSPTDWSGLNWVNIEFDNGAKDGYFPRDLTLIKRAGVKEVSINTSTNGRHCPGHNTQVYEFVGKSYVGALAKMTDRLTKSESADSIHVHSVTVHFDSDAPYDESFLVYLYVDGEL